MKTCTFCSANYPDEYLYCPKDQKPLVDPADLAAGSIVRHKYRILAEAGQDGTSVLYRAQHLLSDTELILKVARTELLTRGGRERFFTAARRAWEIGQLKSPRVIDIDETEQGRPFLVMESTDGAVADSQSHQRIAPANAAGAVTSPPLDRGVSTPTARGDEIRQTHTLIGTPKVVDQPAAPIHREPLYSSRSQTRTALLWSAAVLVIAGVGVILMVGTFRTSAPPFDVPATASIENQAPRPQPEAEIPPATKNVPPQPTNAAEPPIQSPAVPPPAAARVEPARPTERARVDSKREIAEAQVRLGQMYEEGIVVPQDDTQAALWYRRAAEPGHAQAQNSLGHLFENGRGVPRDYMEAVAWYRKAADQGFAPAQNNLANAYALGKGVLKNQARAVAWYRKAADQGYVVAQANLGWVYQNGRGVVKNETQAVMWYRRAADQGYAPAQSNLADIYEHAGGTTRNYTQAAQWYLKAAEQGYAPAQSKLGVIYEAGQGVEKSLELAVSWYRRAAAQGYADARKALERLGVAETDL